MNTIVKQLLVHYRKLDFLFFFFLTLLALLNGQITVFYLLYFFWWVALVHIVIDFLFKNRNKNAVYKKDQNFKSVRLSIFGSLFLIGIYFIFLIVFFGFIAGSSNKEIIFANMEVLFFNNWFFNVNLIFIILERTFIHLKEQPVKIYLGAFTPNIIVLHISIILGGFLMFFVLNYYPELLTPENQWGSIIIITPFLLLKGLANKFS